MGASKTFHPALRLRRSAKISLSERIRQINWWDFFYFLSTEVDRIL